VSPRKTVLQIGAKGSKSSSIKTIVDGELPLGILRGAIQETLATLPNQDESGGDRFHRRFAAADSHQSLPL